MSVYLGYNEVTKQYLRSLGGGGGTITISDSASGFTMTGDINMSGNEVVGLDDPSGDSSAANKKYVDDEVLKVGGGLDQATADNRYLQKTDASSTYETQTDAANTYLSKTDATNTYLTKTSAASTYATVGGSYTKSESDTKYELKGATGGSTGGGLSASGFTMTGDIDMGGNKILKLENPTLPKSAANKEYVDNNFLSKHGGTILGNISMSGLGITNLNPTPQSNNDAVTKGYVDNQIQLSGGLSISGITMQGDINMNGNEISGLADPINDDMAASKGFVGSNFLDLAGGTMVGNVDMGGYEITNMLRTPTTDLSAVTKKWVTDEFPTKQEVLGGFTLSGSLDLSGNEVYGLPDAPSTDNSATSKKYVDSKITTGGGGASTSGFLMSGDIDMQQNEILNLPDTPSQDHSAVSKRYVMNNFVESSGDTMTGDINMGGHSITNIGVLTTNSELVNKKYVDDEVAKSGNTLQKSGGTMKGDINMGGYEVIGVTSVPSFNNSLVNKKYVDDEVAAVNGGILQAHADGRYVRKTKLTLGEWMDTFDDVNFVDYNWSKHVKKSTLNSESNIEIRVASFVTDMSISQLLKHKLVIDIWYVDPSSTISKHLFTIPLSGKSFSKLSYGVFSGYMYSFHIHEEYYVGNDSDAKNSFLWQVGAKFETTKSHVLLDTSAHVSFALNEAGQYG